LLARGQYAWSAATIAAHLGGSLLMTVLGMQTFKWLHQ
jgi:CrcB protein